MRNLFIALPLLTLPFASQAADQITVNVKGTLIAPTVCNVTSNGEIDFGNIISSKINGTEYKRDLNVNLACTDRNTTEIVYVTLTGAGTSTNKLPITGVAKGFQLALKRNTATQNFGARFRVDTNGSLNLNITPEKTTATFVHGTFAAVITVKVDVV